MKKILLLSLIIVLGVFTISAQETEAPTNPEFIKWQQAKANGEDVCGEIPPPVLPHFNNTVDYGKDVQFDAVYDLRTQDWLTTPKDQANCGVCWTFTSLGSIESFLLKSGEGTYDFSEQNMRTCHGFILGDNFTCSGGSAKKAFAYLSRMDGPIEDVLLPYDADELATCTEYRADEFCFNQMKLFPDDHDVVKQAVLDYGGIYTNMCYEGGYYNSTDNTYYFDGDLPTDHAVLLCGWDDNKLTAGGTGAWIIKNSWGDDWGESGFFYISYNDTKFLSTVGAYPGYTRITSGDTIYMYNELGSISNTGYGAETAYGLVKFITGGENEINRLGTYINTEGTTISFEVYDDKSGNTLSNLLTSMGPFTCDFPGYHSFEIPTPILLVADEDFYVKVQYNTPGYTYPIPFEKFSDGYADPQIESGVCWISSTGSSWTAYGNDVEGKERDLTIRAYAHDVNVSAVSTINKNDFIVYPQPANDVVFVEFENDEYKTIEVLDIKGSLVLKADCNSTLFEISNHKLVSGYYLIKVSTDKNVKTKQLIVY